jgi:integrase
MASICNDPNGRRRITFENKDRERKTLYLGEVSKRTAREIKTKVEAINSDTIAGNSIDRETAKWLGKIGDLLHAKLARVGLVPPREPPAEIKEARLGPFIDSYIAGRSDAKERTILNLRMFGDRLIAFFGADKPLADVKRSDADAWIVFLKDKYAAATTGRTIKGARQFFKAACRAEIIHRNPFEGIKAGSHTDKDRQYFVTPEAAQRVLDACPDAEWRLLFALSRFGGLRCPSEHLALTWQDVNWERSRFRVDSPKTGPRWVPIFPELRPYLEDALALAPDGAVYVVHRYRSADKNFRTRFVRIIRRAGLEAWPKLFQNLRASRETELAARHPLHVVCAWIGNSTLVAHKHYLQVTDADFDRAVNSAPDSALNCKTAQKTAQNRVYPEATPKLPRRTNPRRI